MANSDTECRFCSKIFSNKYNCARHESHYCHVFKKCANVKDGCANVKVGCANVKDEMDDVSDQNGLKCPTCYKTFTSTRYFDTHKDRCKRIQHPFQCHKCFKVYASRQSKYEHLMMCKGVPQEQPQPVNTQTIIHNNNTIHNNIVNNTLNVNIHVVQPPRRINDFGHETEVAINNELLDNRSNYKESGVIQIIKHVHFNDQYPENNNLRKGRNKKRMKVRENGKWIEYNFYDKYISILKRYTDLLHSRLLDPQVKAKLGEYEIKERYNSLLQIDPRTNPNEFYLNMDRFREMLEKVEQRLCEEERCLGTLQ